MEHREIFSDARWLSPKASLDAALFRAEIELESDAENAEITISGLGYFILYINGQRVGEDEFVPAYSDYHDRPDMCLEYPLNDIWSHRIYALKYDVKK
ncbi:MAG: alpha-L-rhamnosidase N-terminal domain-containing protein, partial [Oscillospiraceae bacterium]|nr:alpha-L-rhamnosidase N-terminal domain-containing protein [Oscillospiraceae bacterium]